MFGWGLVAPFSEELQGPHSGPAGGCCSVGPRPSSLGPGPEAPDFDQHLSPVMCRRGRVCRWAAGLPRPRHAVQEPHWHLCMHLPPGHAAPAQLGGGLHRYGAEAEASGPSRPKEGSPGLGRPPPGLCPPLWPASSLPPQMRMSATPIPAPAATAAASTPWAASSVTVTRASRPAPPSPSATVSITRHKRSGCGHPLPVPPAAQELPESGVQCRHWGGMRGCCANVDARTHTPFILKEPASRSQPVPMIPPASQTVPGESSLHFPLPGS